jgi:hypothetical protein
MRQSGNDWDFRFSRRRVWSWLSSELLRRVWETLADVSGSLLPPSLRCYLDEGGSKHLWNVSKRLPDYTAQQSRRQPYFRNDCFIVSARYRIRSFLAITNLSYCMLILSWMLQLTFCQVRLLDVLILQSRLLYWLRTKKNFALQMLL